jgi:hypothetical protein
MAALKFSNPTLFASFIVAVKPLAQMVTRQLYVTLAATFLWMASSRLQPRISSTILGWNRMMRVWRAAQIHKPSRQGKQASKGLIVSFKIGLSDISDHLKASENLFFVTLPIRIKQLLQIRMWLGCTTTIKLESSRCRLFSQLAEYKQAPSCKLVVVRMESTGWTVVQGFALWVGILLALWMVDGWVIIWSFVVRLWVSFWCFVYCIITSFIFMHEGLC